MSAADAMAFAALMGSLALIISVFADAYKRRLAFKERAFELTSRGSSDKAAHFAAQAQRLEQRVRVLERIAADCGGNQAADLAEQIEDLHGTAVN